MPDSTIARRHMLGLCGAALTGMLPRRSGQAALPGTVTLLVPGPEDGGLARWSRRMAEGLARAATSAVSLAPNALGGPDGVTAANRFATAAGPDGRTLLVLTGAAAQARLVGDPRARFDLSGWPPVCAVQTPALVVGRRPMPLGRGRPLRLGLGAADAPSTAALLALDLLGLAAVPMPGLSPMQAEAALQQGAVEAIVLQGSDAQARLATLGARSWFSFDPATGRDAALAEVPRLFEILSAAPAPLLAALRCAGASASMPAAVVLPSLTPANLVALWRGAAQRWLEEEARIAPADVRLLPGLDAAPLLTALSPSAEAMLAYREWLMRRLNWKPS